VVAAGVAHELRNPLAAMMMGLDLAQMRLDKLKGELKEGVKVESGHLDVIAGAQQQMEEAAKAVDHVSDITKGLELSHRRRDEDEVANLKEIADLTLNFVRAAVVKRAQLETEIQEVPRVTGSPTKLGQVITNLLVNAMQAMPDRPRTENRISVSLKPGEGWVEFEVHDNGEGISEEVIARVFDPFFTTKTQGGTGLGLAISKKIIEEAKGTIEVRSELGNGTRFTVRLPTAEA
jgi:signal transduction histidine kinase